MASATGRMRPMMLTAISTVLGLIPIAPTVFWGPMAFAIMGGLLVATLLTLVLLPMLYVAVFGNEKATPRCRGPAVMTATAASRIACPSRRRCRAARCSNCTSRDMRQLFNAMDPAPFRERDLDPNADDYIVDWGREAPAGQPLGLVVQLGRETPTPETPRCCATRFTRTSAQRAQATRRRVAAAVPRRARSAC